MSEAPLPDVPRVDAHDKVRGAILFGADHSTTRHAPRSARCGHNTERTHYES